MENVEMLREMSNMMREAAEILDEVTVAMVAEDEKKIDDAMGRFVMKMLRLQALKGVL